MALQSRVIVWAFGMVALTSMLAGIVAVAIHGGFGAADLAPFAVWSAMFAVAIAFMALGVSSFAGTWRLPFQYLVSVALGTVAGLLWTRVFAAFLGGWVAACSIPVLACWILAGGCGLSAGLTASAQRRPAFKLVEAMVLCLIAALGMAVYSPIAAAARHDQTVTIIAQPPR